MPVLGVPAHGGHVRGINSFLFIQAAKGCVALMLRFQWQCPSMMTGDLSLIGSQQGPSSAILYLEA